MNTAADVLQKEFRITQAIWFVILGALAVYVVIGHAIAGRDFVDAASVPLGLIRNILAGIGGLMLIGSFIIRQRVIATAGAAAGQSPGEAGTAVAAKFRIATMIAATFCESVGLFGLVLVILGDGLRTLYLFNAAAAAAMILHRPKMEELERLAGGSGVSM